ncbi:MAG: aspartate kinase [Pseudomonadota bacterium]
MALFVQKYGGTSLANLACIKNVADRIVAAKNAGHQVVVVVSAMSGETDRLIKLAHAVTSNPHPREYDVLISTGEQVAMAILAMELNHRGYKAQSYTGSQLKILTENRHKKAKIKHIDTQLLKQTIDDNAIAIVAGFQGVDEYGNITTFGRGGSDTTAVAIAHSLKADECQIYSDVAGVFTADPRIVAEARRLDHITFEEMIELASSGAKILQKRAVELSGKYKVPLRVLSSFDEGPGTYINFTEMPHMEHPVVSGITYNRNEAKITIVGIPDKPNIAYKIMGPISAANIDVDMIIQNNIGDGKANFTFTVAVEEYEHSLKILDAIVSELGAKQIIGDKNISKLSVVGMGMRTHCGIASVMFNALGLQGINIQFISTSEIKVSVIVAEKHLELGVQSLHSAFGLECATNEGS